MSDVENKEAPSGDCNLILDVLRGVWAKLKTKKPHQGIATQTGGERGRRFGTWLKTKKPHQGIATAGFKPAFLFYRFQVENKEAPSGDCNPM